MLKACPLWGVNQWFGQPNMSMCSTPLGCCQNTGKKNTGNALISVLSLVAGRSLALGQQPVCTLGRHPSAVYQQPVCAPACAPTCVYEADQRVLLVGCCCDGAAHHGGCSQALQEQLQRARPLLAACTHNRQDGQHSTHNALQCRTLPSFAWCWQEQQPVPPGRQTLLYFPVICLYLPASWRYQQPGTTSGAASSHVQCVPAASLTCCQHAPVVAVQQHVLRRHGCPRNLCEVTLHQRGACIVRLGQHAPAQPAAAQTMRCGESGARQAGRCWVAHMPWRAGNHRNLFWGCGFHFKPRRRVLHNPPPPFPAPARSCTHSCSTSACRGVRCDLLGDRRCRAASSGMMPCRACCGSSSCSLKRRHSSTTVKCTAHSTARGTAQQGCRKQAAWHVETACATREQLHSLLQQFCSLVLACSTPTCCAASIWRNLTGCGWDCWACC